MSQQLKDVFERAATSVGEDHSDITVDISTQALWRAILATETKSSPNIELNSASIKPSDTDSELILPYEADIDPLGAFASTDEVEALLIDQDGAEKVIGEVFFKKSALNEVRLNKVRSSAYGLKDGDSASSGPNKTGLHIANGRLHLKGCLIGKGSCLTCSICLTLPATRMQRHTTFLSLTRTSPNTTGEDQHGNKISLNEQQREAFTKLLNYGPLSLLRDRLEQERRNSSLHSSTFSLRSWMCEEFCWSANLTKRSTRLQSG